MAAAELLLMIIPEELARGNRVELGEFGTFTLKTKTKGVAAEEEVTVRNIISTNIAFRPGKEAQKGLIDITFEKMS